MENKIPTAIEALMATQILADFCSSKPRCVDCPFLECGEVCFFAISLPCEWRDIYRRDIVD